MTPKKPVSKKRAKKAAPKYVSQADHDALSKRIDHIENVLSRRFGFNIVTEPEDIVEAESA